MESSSIADYKTPPRKRNWLLIIIFLIGFSLRLYGMRWGLPSYFHPDERQVMFKTTDISWQDPNPHFFAYGSLPIYFLKGVMFTLDRANGLIVDTVKKMNPSAETLRKLNHNFPRVYKNFKSMTLTGRVLSALFSAWTILIIYLLACLLYRKKVALLASAFFAFSVLSIQQAHFYVVDGPQTFLAVCAMYFMVKTAVGDRSRDYYYSGLFLGLAMATKFSSLPLYVTYVLAQFLGVFYGKRKGWSSWFNWIGGAVLSLLVMTACMPYWILDHKQWWHDISEQSRMVRGIARLPYTIQYVDTKPFIYLIKNMVFWSMGIPLGIAAYIGFGTAIYRFFTKSSDIGNRLILSYIVPLFFLNSTFQVKFLRYTLPLFPFFAIFAARWLFSLLQNNKWRRTGIFLIWVTLLGTVFWALAFENIYNYPNTRIEASNWVYSKIPKGAHILVESNWDDQLPVGTRESTPGQYTIKKLDIYREPDNSRKAAEMAEKLEWGDVIILASKRHYGSVLRVPKRYPICGNFYRSLFAERIGYRFVKAFTQPPHIGRLKFDDDLADESFRVYEHPRVDIFQKETSLTKDQILEYLTNPPPEVRNISYEEILTANPVDQLGSKIPFPVVRWILALEFLGILFFPTVFLIFNRFQHKGYPLAKVTGLLTVGYFCWLIPALKLIPFSRILILLILVLFLWGNWLLYLKNKQAIHDFVRRCWWSILGYELLFFTIFGIFAFLRSYNPDIFWSESSMDLGFINAILRADFFPPPDPWIGGEVVNYYYYGHYLAAFMTKLTGITSSYGYNLFFITIPSLVALAIGSLIITLTRRVWAGIIGVIITILIGNLDGVAQIARIWVRISRNTGYYSLAKFFESFVGKFLVLGRNEVHFRFFRSAHELINPTVHEFPYWSYNFMDLHAHTIATLISSFILTLHLVLFYNKRKGFDILGKGITRYLTLAVLAISLGALIPTNSWDFPTHCLVIFIILLIVPVSKKFIPVPIAASPPGISPPLPEVGIEQLSLPEDSLKREIAPPEEKTAEEQTWDSDETLETAYSEPDQSPDDTLSDVTIDLIKRKDVDFSEPEKTAADIPDGTSADADPANPDTFHEPKMEDPMEPEIPGDSTDIPHSIPESRDEEGSAGNYISPESEVVESDDEAEEDIHSQETRQLPRYRPKKPVEQDDTPDTDARENGESNE